jgi:membrane fusion protein (multidrug efflux system)
MESALMPDGTSHNSRRMGAPLIVMLVVVAIVLGAIFGWKWFLGTKIAEYMTQAAAAPQMVSTIKAARSGWQPQIQAVGSLRAVRGADLSAQASGVVDAIEFESGNEVPAGRLLLRLKPNDDYAKLHQLEAAAELADQTYKRDQEQFKAQAVSQATIDTDVSTLKAARAQVAAQEALIEEKVVRAPFAGRLGIRQVDLGQYLTAGTTVVTLQALDPILIDFYVPQQALEHLKIGQAVSATVDTFAGVAFPGTIESINSKVDIASRNIQVRASFRNTDRRLLPGMFASVAIDSGDTRAEITLPQASITYAPYGDTVYIVQPGKSAGTAPPDHQASEPQYVVQQRLVTLGATRGDQVAVLSGVKEGDIVVTAGQMKLRNGTAVTINNSVQPADEQNPTPPNE